MAYSETDFEIIFQQSHSYYEQYFFVFVPWNGSSAGLDPSTEQHYNVGK